MHVAAVAVHRRGPLCPSHDFHHAWYAALEGIECLRAAIPRLKGDCVSSFVSSVLEGGQAALQEWHFAGRQHFMWE